MKVPSHGGKKPGSNAGIAKLIFKRRIQGGYRYCDQNCDNERRDRFCIERSIHRKHQITQTAVNTTDALYGSSG